MSVSLDPLCMDNSKEATLSYGKILAALTLGTSYRDRCFNKKAEKNVSETRFKPKVNLSSRR